MLANDSATADRLGARQHPPPNMLQQLAHPLTITLGLLVLAVLFLLLRRGYSALAFLLLAFAWTYALATPAVSDRLRGSLEAEYPPEPIDRIPTADAIVVLGGGVQPRAGARLGPNLNGAADRLWVGARLYAANKAPLVITTGTRPYTDSGPTAAEAGAQILRTLAVPNDAIIAPGNSIRTYTDALIVNEIATERGFKRVLLVTSALHMPRAVATFEAVGVPVFPAPTDYEVAGVPNLGEYRWLPSTDAFWHSSQAFHEYVGSLYYRYRGWI